MKKENWKIHSNRFISYIDIMGFKDYLMKNSNEAVYDRMLNIVIKSREIKNSANEIHENFKNGKELLKITIFSDSIIIYSKDDSVLSASAIFFASANLFNFAIMESIPLKGAISHGMLSVNEKNNLLIGKPLVDAYYLQEEISYYGIVADNNIDSFISEKDANFGLKAYFHECETPMKSNHAIHLNLNCLSQNYKLNEDKTKFTMQKNEMIESIKKIRTNVTGKPRQYIDNTLIMIERINPQIIEFPNIGV